MVFEDSPESPLESKKVEIPCEDAPVMVNQLAAAAGMGVYVPLVL